MTIKTSNIHRGFTRIFILCLFFCLYVGKATAALTADSLAARLMYQVWSFPQEKVYVVTDRDAYTSDDTVRFRAFLVDAATHAKPKQESRFVYVELINPFGKVEKRIKIRSEEGKFAGILHLDEELAEGNYTLCAYTRFMENSGKDYFFRKTLPVLSLLSKKYKLEVSLENDFLYAHLKERNTEKPVRAEKLSIIGPDSTFFADRIRKRSSISMSITPKMKQAGFVKIKFDRYEKYLSIPYDTSAFSLTFHPEGGYLIPGISNQLAFKAIDRKGKALEFKGTVIDESGNEVAKIESTHRGMGVINITPEKGRNYMAIIDSMSFPLPTADSNAVVLTVNHIDKDSVKVDIRGSYRDHMSLIIHNGGVVSEAIELKEPSLTLCRNKLGYGIVQLLLADNHGNLLSSRMIFNHSGYIYNTPADSLPKGDYTVKAFCKMESDSTASIVSNLLLQSELKGHIEDPDYYFRNRNDSADSHLDILLLTQGWERYDIPNSFMGKYTVPETPLELGGEITGMVKTRWRGKPLEGALVMMLAPKMEYAAQALSDTDGRFVIDGFDWPEDTSFIVRVLSESGDKEHNYTVNDESFPISDPIYTEECESSTENTIDEHLLYYGTIMLDELEVTAPLTPEESHREMMNALGVKSVTSDEIEKMHATTYEEVIRKIPGLRIIDGNVRSPRTSGVYNKGSYGSGVEFWVDGSKWYSMGSSSSGSLSTSLATFPNPTGGGLLPEHTYTESVYSTLSEFAAMYPLHLIKSIEYYPPVLSVIISNSAAYGGGALVFTTKDASEIKEWDADLFIREFNPLGYQDEPEAYRPHYIYDPTSDDTVFNAAWIPSATGLDEIPRQAGTTVVVEGIADGFIPVLVRESIPDE